MIHKTMKYRRIQERRAKLRKAQLAKYTYHVYWKQRNGKQWITQWWYGKNAVYHKAQASRAVRRYRDLSSGKAHYKRCYDLRYKLD